MTIGPPDGLPLSERADRGKEHRCEEAAAGGNHGEVNRWSVLLVAISSTPTTLRLCLILVVAAGLCWLL